MRFQGCAARPHEHQVKENPDGIDRGGHGEPQRWMQFCPLCSSATAKPLT